MLSTVKEDLNCVRKTDLTFQQFYTDFIIDVHDSLIEIELNSFRNALKSPSVSALESAITNAIEEMTK